MVYNGRCITVFGGMAQAQKGTYAAVGDTWEWDGKYWIERLDFGPPPRAEHSMAFDSGRGRVVLFGGMGPSIDTQPPTLIRFGDTWELIEHQDVG
jgi:hypothetical protein